MSERQVPRSHDIFQWMRPGRLPPRTMSSASRAHHQLRRRVQQWTLGKSERTALYDPKPTFSGCKAKYQKTPFYGFAYESSLECGGSFSPNFYRPVVLAAWLSSANERTSDPLSIRAPPRATHCKQPVCPSAFLALNSPLEKVWEPTRGAK